VIKVAAYLQYYAKCRLMIVCEVIVVFVCHSLDEIDKTYQSIADLGVKLKAVREENSRHGQVSHHAANCHVSLLLDTDIERCHSKLYSKLACVAKHRPTMCVRLCDC